MTKRSLTPMLLACAIGVACGGDNVLETAAPPIVNTLELTPGAAIAHENSVTFGATLTRSRGVAGPVDLQVTGVPTGVEAVISNVHTAGPVTTATVTLNLSAHAVPGVYNLVVHGMEAGVADATAAFALTVELPPCPASGVCEQWAASATASSQYTDLAWGATQATGQPNSVACEDDGRAWASLESSGVEWLELVYSLGVRPTEIRIYEVFGVSSIVKVEVKDASGTYYTVYTAQPLSQACPRVLTIPIAGISAMVNTVRVTVDQGTLNNWDEIDAVKLVGER